MRALPLCGAIFLALAARGDVLHVTNGNDSGAGSFRAAADQANLHVGIDEIIFDVSTVTIVSPVHLTDETVFTGGGATVVAHGASPAAVFIEAPTSYMKDLGISNDGGAALVIRADFTIIDTCRIGPASGDGIRVENHSSISILRTTVIGSEIGINVIGGTRMEVLGSSIGRVPESSSPQDGGNRSHGIRIDEDHDIAYIGNERNTCNTPNCVRNQNVIANNGGDGVHVDGKNTLVQWNVVVDNKGNGIASSDLASRSQIIDNWVARNGKNGITVSGRVDANVDNSGECDAEMLAEIAGDGPSPPNDPRLEEAANAPEIIEAIRDQHSMSVRGDYRGDPSTTYLIAFHPQSENCPREKDDFDWHPETFTIVTDATGRASFATVLHTIAEGIIATAVDPNVRKMSESSPLLTARQTEFEASDVAVTMSAAVSGGSATITTTVTNRGPAGALDVVVTFARPFATLSRTTSQVVTYDSTGNVATIGGLPAGSSVTFTDVYPFPGGTVQFGASATHDHGNDLNPANDAAVVRFAAKHRAAKK